MISIQGQGKGITYFKWRGLDFVNMEYEDHGIQLLHFKVYLEGVFASIKLIGSVDNNYK